MEKHSPGRGARAWQVRSVWVKKREGPERVLSAYRLLLDLPPRRAVLTGGLRGLPPRPERDPVGAEEATEAAFLCSTDTEPF
jgi:hypothetical protein